jgi:pimeloyl-ACP methyl ester carboxylesterase
MTDRARRALLPAALLALGLALPATAQTDPDLAPDPATAIDPPGTLIEAELILPALLPAGVQGWRILYATTIDDTTPATAVATILAPAPLPDGPLPAIAWAHGTTGLLQRCMPSRFPDPTAGIPALPDLIANGWAVIATDYAFAEPDGPHPYMIGEGAARGVLDSLRAARTVPGLPLDQQHIVWGHSQGGHAALWTGIIAPAYAPEIAIAGIAAIAPAADPAAILAASPQVDLLLGPYVAAAYARFYPELGPSDIIRPGARMAARDMATFCAVYPPSDTARLFARAGSIPAGVLMGDAPAFAARLAENAATGPIAAPLLLAQGTEDIIVPATLTAAWAEARCAEGQPMEILRFAGQDHAGIVLPDSPLDTALIDWTAARLADTPPPDGCPVTER